MSIHRGSANELQAVAGSLHREFDSRLGVTAVDAEIRKVAHRFTDARISTFVPLFVGRYAGRALRDRLRPAPTPVAVTSRSPRALVREDGEPPHSVYT